VQEIIEKVKVTYSTIYDARDAGFLYIGNLPEENLDTGPSAGKGFNEAWN
jgi:hypothetical protein